MKTFICKILLILGAFIFAQSCSNDTSSNPSQQGIQSSEDLDVSEDFSFRTTKDIEISLQVLGFDQTPLQSVRLTLYDGEPTARGKELSSGATNQQGIYETTAQLNSFVTTLYLVSNYGTTPIPVTGNSVDYILNTVN